MPTDIKVGKDYLHTYVCILYWAYDNCHNSTSILYKLEIQISI